MIVDVWCYFHLRWFCFSLIRSFWQERRRIEKRQTDQRRKKQGPRLQRTRLFESMCLFVPVHWFKIRLILREMIFCHVCNICNAQFSVQLEELERAFERAPYPDVFASEVSSDYIFFCIFTCVHVFLLVELLALFWKGQKLSCPPPPGAHSKTIGGKSQILKLYVGTF